MSVLLLGGWLHVQRGFLRITHVTFISRRNLVVEQNAPMDGRNRKEVRAKNEHKTFCNGQIVNGKSFIHVVWLVQQARQSIGVKTSKQTGAQSLN